MRFQPDHQLPVRRLADSLLGRETEVALLRRACLERQSLLLVGPVGSGKTALARQVLAGLSGKRAFYLSGPAGLRDLLRGLVTNLHAAGDATLRAQLRAERVGRQDFGRWLRVQSSSRLRGALYRAAKDAPCWIFLDHASRFTCAEAKVVRELVGMCGTSVHCLVRDEDEPAAVLLRNLYWNPASHLRLGPLPEDAARELLERAIGERGLERFELAGFRQQLLRLSGRLPGAILDMTALAAQARYHAGKQIKTRLVYVDYRMAGCAGQPAGGSDAAGRPIRGSA